MAYDIFFLSYGEHNADDKWLLFKERFPHAKRVDGVEGILNAHKTCARRSLTSHFFVVDADNDLLPEFDPGFKVDPTEAQYVHLWYARNPVNRLEYGWGGLKLFPRSAVLGASSMGSDMTTGFELKIIPKTVSVTNFNSTPWEAWRSGFREGAKLSHSHFKNQLLVENLHRLKIWTSVGEDQLNGQYAIAGAMAGKAYAEANEEIPAINDWDFMRKMFDVLMLTQPSSS